MASLDYEALKEQWSDIEERDGVRLSWNVFPSSRMVSSANRASRFVTKSDQTDLTGGFPPRSPHWRSLHTSQGEARIALAAVRTRHLQATLSFRSEPFLVSIWPAHCCQP